MGKFSSEILVIGVNINDWFYTSDITSKAYYNFLDYIKKLSQEHPESKLYINITEILNGIITRKIYLKNTNVKIFIDDYEIKIDRI